MVNNLFQMAHIYMSSWQCFLAFLVLNFYVYFEALNNVFWAYHTHIVDKVRV
jgi:hypothetical protein